ncbi:MAG TPA: YbaB/EbfC family nucleoid-associated protein [Myxococcaceae bacterium]|nr:YbaB/EbfC family nucleoid-associated protein [Myxococcaceae bacterium]
MPGVDLNYFMRQASKLTEKLEQRKKELAEETVEGQAGDGRVKVVATGTGDVRSIKIAPDVLAAGDVGMMEDLIAAAVNSALTQARELSERELGKISGGLKIPGITG